MRRCFSTKTFPDSRRRGQDHKFFLQSLSQSWTGARISSSLVWHDCAVVKGWFRSLTIESRSHITWNDYLMTSGSSTCAFVTTPCSDSRSLGVKPIHLSRQVCARKRPVTCSGTPDSRGNGNSKSNRPESNGRRGRRSDRDHTAADEHAPIPGIEPLSKPPSEQYGFAGWDAIDDDYWNDFRKREIAFRAPNSSQPSDLIGPPHPLDRHGKPSTYPAAVRFDDELQAWVPTSEEEEEKLRNPNPVQDPYFIPEAELEERYTSMRKQVSTLLSTESAETLKKYQSDSSEPLTYGEHMRDLSGHKRKRLGLEPGGWKVVHLGTSSAIPTKKRNVSSTAVVINPFSSKGDKEPSMFLVDAGENTDSRLLGCDWCMTHGYRWIRAIFITHLHGDHVFGLPTLLTRIGRYAQHRRRNALERGDDGSDPVIRIFGPYGTRGFLRTSLYWTNPVGVRFSVSELVPREHDFSHIRGKHVQSGIFHTESGCADYQEGSGVDVNKESPPPHPEEVRVEDIHASEDGLWHVWEENNEHMNFEVVSAPLRHRMPCFGYVFRETRDRSRDEACKGCSGVDSSGSHVNEVGEGLSPTVNGVAQGTFEVDKARAKELGVYGSQFGVLRSGRSVTVSKSGLVVKPEDVAARKQESIHSMAKHSGSHTPRTRRKKVTILGDTCDSSEIADAAMDSDLLVHEATFTDFLSSKARIAMHSTARMAGAFGRQVRAKKLALTHFSSRYEALQLVSMAGSEEQEVDAQAETSAGGNDDDDDVFHLDPDEDEDLASPNLLVREAYRGFGNGPGVIVAAHDFMEHDIGHASEESANLSTEAELNKVYVHDSSST